MDINNLIAFIAVAEKKSFSRAAESLKLTQPAVSKRIAALELELATKLFDRIGRSVQLTEAGNLLFPSAQKIKSELLVIESVVRNPDDEIRGTLSIATTERIGTHTLPNYLHTFRQTYPNVALELQFAETTENLNAIGTGTAELVLCHATTDSPTPRKDHVVPGGKLALHKIRQDKLVIVISKDHPLAVHRQVSIHALSQHPAVLQPKTSMIRKLIDHVFQQHGLMLKMSTEASSFATIRSMVSIGLGWAYLPEHQLQIPGTNQLTVLHVEECKDTLDLVLVNHKERTLSSSARAFTDLITQPATTEKPAIDRRDKTLEEST